MNAITGRTQTDASGFISFAAGADPLVCVRDGGDILVSRAGAPVLRLRGDGADGRLTLVAGASAAPRQAVLAAAEAMFAADPGLDRLRLDLGERRDLADELVRLGAAVAAEDGGLSMPVEMFWQLPEPWLAGPVAGPYPQLFAMTEGRRHPRRPPKPGGTVYARYIPWLGEVLSFRVASLDQDVERLNRWMNDPRVAAIWDEAGDLDKHRAYVAGLLADPHMLPLVGCFDGVPFAWFEVYWAKENRLGPFYDCGDYDRGWHVLVGEDAYRGRHRVAAWLPTLMHYIFLSDCRTQRIVGEPRADHAQQIRNLEKSGFAKIKHFHFPHKRAVLVSLLRERFFNDRLWAPELSDAVSNQS